MTNSSPPLDAPASPEISSLPTRQSPFAIASWIVLILELIYVGSVVAYAYHKSPTYPFQRFQRNVGNIDTFLHIDAAFFVLGVILAVAGVVHPQRKRWLAFAALFAHLFMGYMVAALESQAGVIGS